MPTILEVLTRPNVPVNSVSVVPGSNTMTETTILPDGWSPWPDFTHSTLTRIFHTELRKEYHGSDQRKALERELLVNNERTLETLLLKFVSPTICFALDNQKGQAYLGEGSRCGDDADWSAISDQWYDEYGYFNLLPGDTKLDAKWRPTMLRDNFQEWQKVVSQVEMYMARNSTRYGFILTETNLVVLRLTRQPVDAGLALSRPQRGAATSFIHQRHSSDVSMASTDISGSAYSDNNAENWAYYNPEYAIIDWAASGQGSLTIKLALWCLVMMATNGDRYLDYSYPGLDTWRWDGASYVHNSSGATKPTLSKRDVRQEPDAGMMNREANFSGGTEATSDFQLPDHAQSPYAQEDARVDGSSSYYHGNVPIHPHGGSSADYQAQQFPGQTSQYSASTADPGYNDDDKEDDDGKEDDDDKTVIEHQRRKRGKRSRRLVQVRTHKKGGGLYYENARGEKIDTTKEEWTKVKDGYELEGRNHVYYTKKFPR